MSRYIDADEVLEQIRKKLGIKSLSYLLEAERQIVDVIQSAPSIDIVRCKDCIENDINISGTENWCLHFGYDVEDDGFCNYGERVDEPNYYDPALHE